MTGNSRFGYFWVNRTCMYLAPKFMERGLGIANMQVSDGHVDSANHALYTILNSFATLSASRAKLGRVEKEESVDLCLYV